MGKYIEEIALETVERAQHIYLPKSYSLLEAKWVDGTGFTVAILSDHNCDLELHEFKICRRGQEYDDLHNYRYLASNRDMDLYLFQKAISISKDRQ